MRRGNSVTVRANGSGDLALVLRSPGTLHPKPSEECISQWLMHSSRGSAAHVNRSRRLVALSRPEEPIPSIAEPRQNVALRVELSIE